MLKLRPKISEKAAKKMIFSFVRHGDHSNRGKTDVLSDKQVEQWFSQNNYHFKKLCSSARNWGSVNIPFVENLMHSMFHSSSGDAQIIGPSGNVQAEIKGGGVLVGSDYQEKFRSAIKHKKQAVLTQDIEEFYSCLTKAFSSIESFFTEKASIYNSSSDSQLVDSKENPVSLESKFKDWVPVLSNGRSFDLGKKSWVLFIKHQSIRHNHAIHPKHASQGISYEDFAALLNEFRDGVARIYYDLHVLLGENIKRPLIREVYSPDVYFDKNI